MSTKSIKQLDSFFQNSAEHFNRYMGNIISSKSIKETNFSGLNVVIVGLNQMAVSQLDAICQHAQSVKVFQMTPAFVLPHTERAINRLVSHPLIIKNRRLFNNRVKSLLAVRYLDSQVQDIWLKRQLTPNFALEKKVFLKSDTYYTALQRENCHLITWPVMKVTEQAIQSMEGSEHFADIVITTFD